MAEDNLGCKNAEQIAKKITYIDRYLQGMSVHLYIHFNNTSYIHNDSETFELHRLSIRHYSSFLMPRYTTTRVDRKTTDFSQKRLRVLKFAEIINSNSTPNTFSSHQVKITFLKFQSVLVNLPLREMACKIKRVNCHNI